MTRTELITSREFWVAQIHVSLWNLNGRIEKDSDKWERMANKIVDERFHKLITEISQAKIIGEANVQPDVRLNEAIQPENKKGEVAVCRYCDGELIGIDVIGTEICSECNKRA